MAGDGTGQVTAEALYDVVDWRPEALGDVAPAVAAWLASTGQSGPDEEREVGLRTGKSWSCGSSFHCSCALAIAPR
jgi:hypothetical protein